VIPINLKNREINMDESKEIKPASFRISNDIKEKFKEIAKTNGWNQDETLGKLIGIYELEEAKVTISNRRTEIENFEAHLQALSEIYCFSLRLNQDVEERVRIGYANTLKSHQTIIEELQKKNEELKNTLEKAQELARTSMEKSSNFERENTRLQNEIEKTEALCQEYKDTKNTLTQRIKELENSQETNQNLKIDNKNLRRELKNLESTTNNEIITMKLKHSEKIEEINQINIKKLENTLTELEEARKEIHLLKAEKLLITASEDEPPVKPKKTSTRKSKVEKDETIS
jgi:chromosome segregation ATPase